MLNLSKLKAMAGKPKLMFVGKAKSLP